MTTAINLRYGMSPPETCRVEVIPNTCSLGPKSQMKGGQTYTNPQGVTYQVNGMIVKDYNAGLRVPQMRTFLGPEYFNSGCSTLYCKDGTVCPASKLARSCGQTNAMFDSLFNFSQGDHIGNDAPPSCFGGKCAGYNTVSGWEVGQSGQPKWMSDNAMQCGQTFSM